MTQCFYQTGLRKESAVNIAVEYMKSVTKNRGKIGFINAVLRKVLEFDPEEFYFNLSKKKQKKYYPHLFRRWKHVYGEDNAKQLVSELIKKPEFVFREVKKLSDAELDEVLAEELEGLPNWGVDVKFFKATNVQTFFQSNLLADGKVYIQDPSTVFATSLIKINEGETVLDLCAAPGGKSILLSERLPKDAELILCDVSERRIELIKDNLMRIGLDHKIIHTSVEDAPFDAESIDKILLDVPCSNTGVIRKRPDVLWRFDENELKELIKLQKQILSSAFSLLKPGGEIVYSTCSIEPEENIGLVESFVEGQESAEVIEFKQLLPNHLHDGGFACLIRKN
jgi:16S rRNA (cytosine967-C5)-methyltransferase